MMGPIGFETTVRITAVLLATHAIMMSLEHLSTSYRYRDAGLISWSVVKLHARSFRTGRLITPALQGTRYSVVLIVQLFIGVTLLVAANGDINPILPLALLVTYTTTYFRHHVGHTGDIDMAVVVSTGLFLATAASPRSDVATLGLLFIGAQGALSYCIAGISKLGSTSWQSGAAIGNVFSTKAWGDRRVHRLFERFPSMRLVGSWSVIGFESLFVLVLVTPFEIAIGIIAVAVGFHAFNAMTMGLNRFLIGFAASYPSILFANSVVRSVL